MPSQFFGLYIAGSGLRASNASLNTTANNIANAQTTGYSRQQVSQQASFALRVFNTYGCAGAGVSTLAIERVRDSFYDVKYWNNNSKLGETTVKQYYMQSLEDYFKDETTSGFRSIFDVFDNALQSVKTNASSNESKRQFISSAKSLTDYFNNMYGNLQELQKDLNLEIKQTVDQINSIAQQLATLNKQINVIELSGATANELRDQRELLIDQLSELVDVEVEEFPVVDVNNPDRETGGTRCVVRIAGGQPLVDGNSYNQLKYVARSAEQKVNQTDIDGLYDVMWENGNDFNLVNDAMEGRLKGLVQLRDGNNGANFRGKVSEVDVNANTVTVEVTEEYLKSMQDCTLSDTGGKIYIGNTIYYYESWEYDPETSTYTFKLRDDTLPKITANKVGREVETPQIKYQGIPYYMEQMNAWIRGFAEKVNEIFMNGYDANGNPGALFFTGSKNGDQYSWEDFMDADGNLVGNGYYELTAGNFTINQELLDDASRLGTRSESALDGEVEECGQIDLLVKMLSSKTQFSFRNATAGELLELLLGDVALNASDANTFYDTYNGLRNSIDNQRSSISGVDEDEEAVSLVKYQHAYTLASKMIQTLTEIYDQLILRTGV